jgi:hypothetical protein
MVMEDPRLTPPPDTAGISGRRLFWILATFFGAPVLAALVFFAWEFLEAQRIWAVINAHAGFTDLAPGSIAIGDSYGMDGLIDGRPLFRYQVVKVSIGFHSDGENADFSQPLRRGQPHPLAVLERLPNLAEVVLSSSRISPEGVACLARCRRLARLHLSAKELTAQQLQRLAACSSLRELTLDGPSLSGAAIARLRPLTDLESLRFDHAQLDKEALLELSQMKNLRDLHFFYTELDQSTLGCLARLPNLQNLSLSTLELNRAAYQGVGRMTALQSLCLRRGMGWADPADHPTLGDEMDDLSNLTELKELYLECGRITGASLETLLRFTKLQTLYAESELTDDEAIRLANGLHLNQVELYSPNFCDPNHICNRVTAPKLYVRHGGWSLPGHVITTFEPR